MSLNLIRAYAPPSSAFEGIVVFHILLVAVTVGLDLTYERENPSEDFKVQCFIALVGCTWVLAP